MSLWFEDKDNNETKNDEKQKKNAFPLSSVFLISTHQIKSISNRDEIEADN